MKSSDLRPLDVLILLKKITSSGTSMTYRELAVSLQVSISSISDGLSRLRLAQLVDYTKKNVNVLALEEFLVYGLKYVFPVEVGHIVRGIPTYISAPPLKDQIASSSESFVWPCSHGTTRGQKIVPLYLTVPYIVEQDEELYRLLVIVDALRIGRVREREIAMDALHKYVEKYGKDKH